MSPPCGVFRGSSQFMRVVGKGVFSFRMDLKVLTADLKTSVY